MESIGSSVLWSLNIAVLQRIGPRDYKVLGEVPAFYKDVFPTTGDEPCQEPWKYSFMLEFFLQDAELFFERNRPGVLDSGIWQETDACNFNQALIATAIVKDDLHLLCIRLLEKDFVQGMNALQKMRDRVVCHEDRSCNVEVNKNGMRLDPKTGLLNKESFGQTLGREVSRAMSLQMDLSLLFLEVDDYSLVIDVSRQGVGEELLKNIGAFLDQKLRNDDIVAYFDNSLFAVLAPYTTPIQAYMLAEKLRSEIEDMNLVGLPHITLSIGCTTYVSGESQ